MSAPFLIAMAVNAVTFFIAGLLLLRLHASHDARVRSQDSGPAPLLRKDKPFLVLIGANTVLALCTMLIGVGLPVYVAEALPAPKWMVGVLLAAVSVVLATGQTLVVRHTERRRRTNVLVLAGVAVGGVGGADGGLLHVPAALVVPGLVLATVVFAFGRCAACGDWQRAGCGGRSGGRAWEVPVLLAVLVHVRERAGPCLLRAALRGPA